MSSAGNSWRGASGSGCFHFADINSHSLVANNPKKKEDVLKSQHPNLLITELAVSQGSAGNPHSFFSREPPAVCSEAPGRAHLMNLAPHLPHMLCGKICPFPTDHGINAGSGLGGPGFLVLYFYCKNNPHKL